MTFHTGQNFTFGEQPSATKWQYLWDNDYALRDGTGIADDAIDSRHYTDGSIDAEHLSAGALTLGYAQRTSDFTTASTSLTDVTSLSAAVTIPSGSRRIKISFGAIYALTSGAAGTGCDVSIYDVTAGAEIGRLIVSQPSTNFAWNPHFITTHVPAAGSRTYKIQASVAAGTLTIHASSTSPAFILVEAI